MYRPAWQYRGLFMQMTSLCRLQCNAMVIKPLTLSKVAKALAYHTECLHILHCI